MPVADPLSSPAAEHVLVMRARGRSCALPLAHVVETLRPLPAAPVEGAPAFVRGVSVIRGLPVTVVDLGALLSGAGGGEPERFVTLRVPDRPVALAVDAVVGVRTLPTAGLRPLLVAGGEPARAVARLDEALLAVLSSARLAPEDASR